MRVQDVVREVMTVNGVSQQTLSEKLGYKRQTNVSELLRGRSMRVDSLLKMLDVMECELVVVSKKEHTIAGSAEKYTPRWTVTLEDPAE